MIIFERYDPDHPPFSQKLLRCLNLKMRCGGIYGKLLGVACPMYIHERYSEYDGSAST
jgi:hypothetical protein